MMYDILYNDYDTVLCGECHKGDGTLFNNVDSCRFSSRGYHIIEIDIVKGTSSSSLNVSLLSAGLFSQWAWIVATTAFQQGV